MSAKKFTEEAQQCFLEVLAETASPTRAAATVGISRRLAYDYRNNDLTFRSEWDAAVEQAMERLLEEAFRRAVIGVEEPVVSNGRVVAIRDPATGEEQPLSMTRHSDRLLEVLLKFRYPDKMADRLNAAVQVDRVALSPDALLAMPATERNQLVGLLERYTAAKGATHAG